VSPVPAQMRAAGCPLYERPPRRSPAIRSARCPSTPPTPRCDALRHCIPRRSTRRRGFACPAGGRGSAATARRGRAFAGLIRAKCRASRSSARSGIGAAALAAPPLPPSACHPRYKPQCGCGVSAGRARAAMLRERADVRMPLSGTGEGAGGGAEGRVLDYSRRAGGRARAVVRRADVDLQQHSEHVRCIVGRRRLRPPAPTLPAPARPP
jgi:hypothetical protein